MVDTVLRALQVISLVNPHNAPKDKREEEREGGIKEGREKVGRREEMVLLQPPSTINDSLF